MAIYLDGMFYRCSGVGRVYENLLDALSVAEEVGDIHTVVPAAQRERFLEQFRKRSVVPVFVEYGPMSPGDLFRKSAILRSLTDQVRLFFFPGHNVPVYVPGRYVVTIHDLTVFSEHFALPGHRKAGFRWLLSRAVRGAEAIVTVSETVKADLVGEFGIPPERIRVIHPWVKEIFFQLPQAERSPVLGDYLLYLGLRIAHKNVEGVIGAFALLLDEFPGLKLVIAGTRYSSPDMVDRWRENPRLEGRLVEVLDPSDEEIVQLLGGAKALVFPSFAEGFGLPPLEAMASGVPVICSDIPVFREIYGDAVRYVDPASNESVAAGIREVLEDPGLSGSLCKKGMERAALYRKERSIRRYIELIGRENI